MPDLTLEQVRERGTSGRAVIEEMMVAGASPMFTDGPFVETKEQLGRFAVVDVPDEATHGI